MSLNVTKTVLEEIVAHAQAEAPIEACGYIGEKHGVAAKVIRLTNADAAEDHFSLIPSEQFAAVRTLRQEGFRLCAVYHSHPASPARMSQEDLRLARDTTLSYVIVSLAGITPVVKSFRVGAFDGEEDISVSVGD